MVFSLPRATGAANPRGLPVPPSSRFCASLLQGKEHYNFGLEDDILSSTDVLRDVEDAAYRRTMDFAFTHGLDQASGDVQIHLKQPLYKYNKSKKGKYGYSMLPRSRYRIAQLCRHMESQQPNSWRQLWRDNRNRSNYYTFWSVIIFGVFGILLALAGLGASIAQAWASFRAIGMT
ncbi:hypothetical protein TGAM01_v205741 [Trichoderma gamsii]|uniref:Uncharacterized protein n=1 Tax=Trichoderma gamsii TaxID=398673 RepID=A0A2P4ZMC5_9HYPO|nr:hypothetical protein TGAM01_v205741 [Trichoderma gamsii]PON25447.1 hypothetical protein TGAM01_v205741 [Trichoderma gamsii]